MKTSVVGLAFASTASLAAGAWQLIAGTGAVGFGLMLIGAVGGIVFLVIAQRDLTRFGDALQSVLDGLSILR